MLHDYNLAFGRPIHTRLYDLFHASRSHVCQKYKLQIAVFLFVFFSLNFCVHPRFKRCVVATYIKNTVHSVCDFHVYLWTTLTPFFKVLHFNVRCLTVNPLLVLCLIG